MIVDYVLTIMSSVVEFFKIPITIDTFTFSFWQVLLFSMVLGFTVNFIGGLLE